MVLSRDVNSRANGISSLKFIVLLAALCFISFSVIAQEREEDEAGIGNNFEVSDSSVTLNMKAPLMSPLSGSLSQGPAFMENKPGVGYDAEVRWESAGPTGFGLYTSLDMAEVGPDASFDPTEGGQPQIFKDGGTILTTAGSRGGLWLRNTSGGAGGWVLASQNLPARYHIVEAVMEPDDADHIFAVIPSDKSKRELLLFETKNGGQSWSKVSYFTKSGHILNDKNGRNLASGGSAYMHYFKNGDIFLFNYNGDNWGYFSDNNGKDWQTVNNLNPVARGGSVARNGLRFHENGNGMLNPTNGVLYRTTDYGQNWEKVKDYSNQIYHGKGADEGLAYDITPDGNTIRVLYKQGFSIADSLVEDLNSGTVSGDLVKAFSTNKANLKAGEKIKVKTDSSDWKVFNGSDRWNVRFKDTNDDNIRDRVTVRTCCYLDTSNDGGNHFKRENLSKPFPARGPQGLLIDPDQPSKLTAFIYMDGPFFSTDKGKSWRRVYRNPKVKKKVWHTHFYDNYTVKLNGLSKGMARPEDYRDVMVMDGYKNNPILIGSDQGLFVMSSPGQHLSPVVFWNAAAGMDHTEVYNVKVDRCGNLYHGLWHHSVMIRKDANEGLGADSLLYYDKTSESGAMFLKDRSDCLGWASVGANLGGKYNFKTYVSNKSGKIKLHDPKVRLKYKDSPAFFAGKWYYVNKADWNMRATPLDSTKLKNLKSNNNLVQARNVRAIKKDPAAHALYYAADYSDYNREPESYDHTNLVPNKLKRLDKGGSTPSTSLDLSDEYGPHLVARGDKPVYDVNDNRVIVLIEDNGGKDILIYNQSKAPVTDEDIPAVENPFPQFEDSKILEVWVDPTDPDRYFASVRDRSRSAGQCPFHLMATEDSGGHWQVFSDRLNCSWIYDIAVNPATQNIYAATHARGVLKGNLGSLQESTDLSVDLICDDDKISENEALNCELDYNREGPMKDAWKLGTNNLVINVDFPFDTHRYEFLTSDKTLREAGCFKQTEKDDHGIYKVKGLECNMAFNNFPRYKNLPLKFFFERSYDSANKTTAMLSAHLDLKQAPQDLLARNDADSVEIELFDSDNYNRDRFDPHYSDEKGHVVSNDEQTSPAQLNPVIWKHDRSSQHLACNGSSQQDCSGILLDPSRDAPQAAIEQWTAEIDKLNLTSPGDDDYYRIKLPKFDSPAMKDKLSNLECGMNTFEIAPRSQTRNQPKSKRKKDEPSNQPTSSYNWSLMFSLNKANYLTYFTNAKPKGYTMRKVDPNLENALSNNGLQLSSRARITTFMGVSQWKNASKWKLIDQGDTYKVEPDGNRLKVYSGLTGSGSAGNNSKTVTRQVETKGWFNVTVVPKRNKLASTGLNPDMVKLQSYRNTNQNSRITVGTAPMTVDGDAPEADKVTMRIGCPKSSKDLSDLIISVGENDKTAGGYKIYLEYNVLLRQAKKTNMQPMMANLGKDKDSTASGTQTKPQGATNHEANTNEASLTLTGKGGSLLSGVSSTGDISGAVGSLASSGSVFTFGGSLAFGSLSSFANLRLTGLHTTGKRLTSASSDNTIKENFTALTADLVIRPIPRIFFQPYAVGGLGFRKFSYSGLEQFESGDTKWKATAQFGAGINFQIGSKGPLFGVEVVDYLSGAPNNQGSLRHDAFFFGTLGIPVY